MENKYIITLEEMPFERFHSYNVPSERLYRVQGFNSLVFDGNGLSKLTPYKEPNLEAIRNEAYEKGYQDAIMKIGSNEQAIAEKAYQSGIIDAWDAARKIVLSREDGGLFGYEERKAVFGCGNYMALKMYLAPEAIEKIRQYEQEKEQQIQIGDEVNGKGGRGIITKISDDGNHFNVMWENGLTGCYRTENFKKTGRNFPEIAEVLRKMQEEKE